MSDTNQEMRTPPEQATPETSVGINDDGFEDSPREKERDQYPANKERGGTVAGGGSRDE